mmetsp:Transcript_73304/g.177308  ORF Transcript_73304/g.177308 Transcript_73304/m.177308 type:complete len:203 (-) Transcript_73304:66-674(-)
MPSNTTRSRRSSSMRERSSLLRPRTPLYRTSALSRRFSRIWICFAIILLLSLVALSPPVRCRCSKILPCMAPKAVSRSTILRFSTSMRRTYASPSARTRATSRLANSFVVIRVWRDSRFSSCASTWFSCLTFSIVARCFLIFSAACSLMPVERSVSLMVAMAAGTRAGGWLVSRSAFSLVRPEARLGASLAGAARRRLDGSR